MRHRWHRRGLLIPAPLPYEWAASHAALPAADVTDDGKLDIYFSPRDERGRAHIARRRVLESDRDGELVASPAEPQCLLGPGDLGAFDDSGVTMSCIVRSGDTMLLYYTGWTLGVTVPFYFYVGLAIRRPGTTGFERVSQAPILERNAVDPYLTASPWVLCENGTWRMWYVSCAGWIRVNDETRHRYRICYAESEDGVAWSREGRVSIDFADADEYAISRPCVVRDPDCYRMWFAARGDRYRLGYAESHDGLEWTRDDSLAGLNPPYEDWEAGMVAYPSILDHGGQRYLLYNGNDYGRAGVGYAVGEELGGDACDPLTVDR